LNAGDVLGPLSNKLSNNGDTVRLRNPAGAILLEIPYNDKLPWPVAADGGGHSLVLARPSFGEGDPRAWDASAQVGGSPGRAEPAVGERRVGWGQKELFPFPAPTNEAFIEIYNHRAQPADLSGCVLTDSSKSNQFVIPSGIVLPKAGFIAFPMSQLGFTLDPT